MITIIGDGESRIPEAYEGVRILLLTGKHLDKDAAGAALRLKEMTGGKVAVAVLGAEGESLSDADATYLLDDKDFLDSDCRATGRIAVAFVKKIFPCDYVVCGTSSAEGSQVSLAARIAKGLDMDFVSFAKGIERSGDGSLKVARDHPADGEADVSWKSVFTVSGGEWPEAAASEADGRRLSRLDIGLGIFSVGTRGSKVRFSGEAARDG